MAAPTTSFDSLQKQWQKSGKHLGGAAVRPAEDSGEPVTVPSSRRYDNRDVATTPSFRVLSWIHRTRTYSPAALG
jgi:hypothetical protein